MWRRGCPSFLPTVRQTGGNKTQAILLQHTGRQHPILPDGALQRGGRPVGHIIDIRPQDSSILPGILHLIRDEGQPVAEDHHRLGLRLSLNGDRGGHPHILLLHNVKAHALLPGRVSQVVKILLILPGAAAHYPIAQLDLRDPRAKSGGRLGFLKRGSIKKLLLERQGILRRLWGDRLLGAILLTGRGSRPFFYRFLGCIPGSLRLLLGSCRGCCRSGRRGGSQIIGGLRRRGRRRGIIHGGAGEGWAPPLIGKQRSHTDEENRCRHGHGAHPAANPPQERQMLWR